MTSWMWTNICFESVDDWHYKLYISYQSWYESLIFSYYKFKQAFFIFHDEHYKLYISYQCWYESLLYPLWIITRGHFCGFCVNNNTYRLKNLAPNFEGRGKTRGFMNFGQPWVWLSQLSLLHLRYIDRIAMIRLSMVEKGNKYINCSQIIDKSQLVNNTMRYIGYKIN